MFTERTYNWKKEHKILEKDDTKVWCSHCGKIVEQRDGGLPDYSLFMSEVWIKQNLPCKPYKNRQNKKN